MLKPDPRGVCNEQKIKRLLADILLRAGPPPGVTRLGLAGPFQG